MNSSKRNLHFIYLTIIFFTFWITYHYKLSVLPPSYLIPLDEINVNKMDLRANEEASQQMLNSKSLESKNKQEVLERNTCDGNYDDETVVKMNSDLLPNRTWIYDEKEGICEGEDAKNCIPKFMNVTRTFEASKPTKTVNCLIHKSMSTIFKILACFLDDPLKFLYYGNDLLDYEHWHSKGKGEARCAKYYTENGFGSFSAVEQKYGIKERDDWQFSMIVRDPVDRFLSAYIHFCYYGHIGDCSRYCNGCGANMTCFLEKELENMFKVMKNKKIKDLKTDHMIQQNWQCGLSEHFERYKFLRYNPDSAKFVDEELAPFLKLRNVSSDALHYIRNRLTSARTKHSTSNSDIRPFLEKRLRKSSYLMEIVVRLFYADYKMFNFTLPSVP